MAIGDHLRRTDGPGGPSMATILGPGDHPQQHILPQMVRGTYFGGTICGMTGPTLFLIYINNIVREYGHYNLKNTEH